MQGTPVWGDLPKELRGRQVTALADSFLSLHSRQYAHAERQAGRRMPTWELVRGRRLLSSVRVPAADANQETTHNAVGNYACRKGK
jgi:hypothetical protein